MRFDLGPFKSAVQALATEGVLLGTSSWKYQGWMGQLYTPDRYVYRGRFAESRFDRLCLSEYAEVFKTVCVDAAYYTFPTREYADRLVSMVPSDFLFSFKVTDQITLRRFPKLPRFGPRAGTANRDFLNADLFQTAFLAPFEPVRANVGLFIFEFSKFYPGDFARGRDFVEALDKFLGALPRNWRYGVEIRNRHFLEPQYFDLLARHGVSHVYNSWQDMPPIEEQAALPGSRTTPDFFGARFLLRPGRQYEQAVSMFSPYKEIKDPYPEGQAAGAALIRQARASQGRAKGFVYVNNRFEGNALDTIAGMIEKAGL